LGSDSGEESKVSLVGLTSKIGDGFDARSKLFHIRVIMRHTKVNTLIDNGFQSNLISDELVKQLGLNTQIHHKPYRLKWISNNHQLHITEQCTFKFAITSKFVDEVTCDLVPLNECGMVLRSPFFFQEKIAQIYIWYKFLYKANCQQYRNMDSAPTERDLNKQKLPRWNSPKEEEQASKAPK
jgi:hypothetical protein